MLKKLMASLLIGSTILVSGCSTKKVEEEKKEINISAAVSVKEALEEIKEKYEKSNNVKINLNLGASGTLQKQIEDGAKVDIFLSAAEKNMKDLVKKDLVSEKSVSNFLTNSMVLIKANDSKSDIKSFDELKKGNIKIAVGDKAAPLGIYTEEAFQKQGILKALEPFLIHAKDAKATINYVERGEVDFGIIYYNDSKGLKNSTVIDKIDDNLHSPIIYPVAPLKASEGKKEITDLIKYMTSSEGVEVFKKHNFTIK